MTEREAKSISALTLAYVGDAVFTLYVRRRLAEEHDFKPGELTRISAKLVSAAAQSAMLDCVSSLLDEEETAVVKRCRNAHVGHKAKNFTLSDYKRATALEGLVGYLELTGRADRLSEILRCCWEYGYEQSR